MVQTNSASAGTATDGSGEAAAAGAAAGAKEGADDDEEDDGPKPVGNGGSTEHYVWTQTLSEVSVNVPMPPGTKGKMVEVKIGVTSLKVGVKGQPPIIDGRLHKRVKLDDCFWTLDEGAVAIDLSKENGMEW